MNYKLISALVFLCMILLCHLAEGQYSGGSYAYRRDSYRPRRKSSSKLYGNRDYDRYGNRDYDRYGRNDRRYGSRNYGGNSYGYQNNDRFGSGYRRDRGYNTGNFGGFTSY